MRPNSYQLSKSTAGPASAANSLFHKILPVSPFDPRFWPDKGRYPLGNLNGIKILREPTKKIQRLMLATKALGSVSEPPLLKFHLLSLHAA